MPSTRCAAAQFRAKQARSSLLPQLAPLQPVTSGQPAAVARMSEAKSGAALGCKPGLRCASAGLRICPPGHALSRRISQHCHARPCAGHPRLLAATETWMAGTSPAMTEEFPLAVEFLSPSLRALA